MVRAMGAAEAQMLGATGSPLAWQVLARQLKEEGGWVDVTVSEGASLTPMPKNKHHTPSEVAVALLVVCVVSYTHAAQHLRGFSLRDYTVSGQSVRSLPAGQGVSHGPGRALTSAQAWLCGKA